MTDAYDTDSIIILGAEEHNLKNIDVKIPRGSITAITGVSGAGKSSLAFDTLLSEAYRKFFFTLSHYFRQFLPTKNKAKIKKITGLSPAIGLSQYETRPSPYASVATITDIGELFGILFSKYSEAFCPKHALATKPLSEDQVSEQVNTLYKNELIAICSPFVESKKGHFRKKLEDIAEKGFLKIYCDGRTLSLSPVPELDPEKKHTIKIIVDYLQVTGRSDKRLSQSLKTAAKLSEGYTEVFISNDKGKLSTKGKRNFSLKAGCPECGYSWPKLDSRYFAANSLGRCPECSGLGRPQDEEGGNSLSKICSSCKGTGLSKEYLSIKVAGQNIHDIYHKTVSQNIDFVISLKARNGAEKLVLSEIKKSLKSLQKMGLGYLNIFRKVSSLSLGEHQRTRLSSVLSQDLSGIIYVLDEPSQGLHASEIEQLYKVLLELKNKGNTLVIVDHDPYLLKKSDWIIDLGPVGGKLGGQKLAEFAPSQMKDFEKVSLTAKSLLKEQTKTSNVKPKKKEDDEEFIEILEASCHNLKIDKVSFKKKAINVVSGVSGSGKTSLAIHTLYNNVAKRLDPSQSKKKSWLYCEKITNIKDFSEAHLINRMPLSKTSASLVVTYLGLFTMIRELFASSHEAKIAGLAVQDFSLRTGSGRCSECSGKGSHILEMKFLEDVELECALCSGKRYKLNVLSVRYNKKSISDVLDFSIDEACEFFHFHRKIKTVLKACQKIGLGYLKLGQASTQFSGGEAQRLKIVSTFLKAKKANKLLVLDEPTRGLHENDIVYLVDFLRELSDTGATIIVIEHHIGLIKEADWLVDLGPGAAEEGGKVLYEGEPFGLISLKKTSQTAKFL